MYYSGRFQCLLIIDKRQVGNELVSLYLFIHVVQIVYARL